MRDSQKEKQAATTASQQLVNGRVSFLTFLLHLLCSTYLDRLFKVLNINLAALVDVCKGILNRGEVARFLLFTPVLSKKKECWQQFLCFSKSIPRHRHRRYSPKNTLNTYNSFLRRKSEIDILAGFGCFCGNLQFGGRTMMRSRSRNRKWKLGRKIYFNIITSITAALTR